MIRKILLTIAVVAFVLFVMAVIASRILVALMIEPAAEQIKQHGIKPGLERLWRGTNQ